MNSVTVFIQRSCNEVFCTQMTDLCWQLSVVRASSQMVVLRCCGLWREEYMSGGLIELNVIVDIPGVWCVDRERILMLNVLTFSR